MNTETDRPELSFDGCGINGPDIYRSRVATFTSEASAKQYGSLLEAAPELLAALEGFEGAFAAWYANSGYMCECLDRLNEAENQGLSAEVARLHNLLARSLSARTAIAKAKGETP